MNTLFLPRRVLTLVVQYILVLKFDSSIRYHSITEREAFLMNIKTEFLKMMSEQTEIALATSVNDVPNVRIVNFYFDPIENILYFSSFKGNDKIKEFNANPHVAFTTIPHTGNEHVKAKGTVQKSAKTIFDVAEQFVSKIPSYKGTIEYAGESLMLFEIRFDTAIVTKDLNTIETIKL